MLTRLTVRNFKRIEQADIRLGRATVLVGPNDSGKTSALQALTLWQVGMREWYTKRERRAAAPVNRKDLLFVPVSSAKLLWRNQKVRSAERREDGVARIRNVPIEIAVEGITHGKPWRAGFEFDYANSEVIYCRPMQELPIEAELLTEVRLAYLPPMSGLASVEPFLRPEYINVLIGEGQTAQVLRNICYWLHRDKPEAWDVLVEDIKGLFGIELFPPKYIVTHGELTMGYCDQRGAAYDLSSAGQGILQSLLLLAYLYSNLNTTILFDEPDAHLDTSLQRLIYRMIKDVAQRQNGQIIAATHSKVVLEEAAGSDTVVSFVGRPHAIMETAGHPRLERAQGDANT